MRGNFIPTVSQPSIVKFMQPHKVGIQSRILTRHAIGFVVRGRKLIYYGDAAHQANSGDMFYMSTGHHYVEDLPEKEKPYEEIVFYFTPAQLSRCLTQLCVNFNLDVPNRHTCDNCRSQQYVVYPSWRAARNFFSVLNQYMKEDVLMDEPILENLKMMELVYMIVSDPECCIQGKILEHSDMIRENFEQIVLGNIFTDCSIEQLAQQTNRSLTSFKKEFKRQFMESPHRWIIRQRLMHARLQLISTNKAVAELGIECGFPNTSHFIKLFKKEFGCTPSVYRSRHNERTISLERERAKEYS